MKKNKTQKRIEELEEEIKSGRNKIMTERIMPDDPFFFEIAGKEQELKATKQTLKEVEEAKKRIEKGEYETEEEFFKKDEK